MRRVYPIVSKRLIHILIQGKELGFNCVIKLRHQESCESFETDLILFGQCWVVFVHINDVVHVFQSDPRNLKKHTINKYSLKAIENGQYLLDVGEERKKLLIV